jgi:hypothetical protein
MIVARRVILISMNVFLRNSSNGFSIITVTNLLFLLLQLYLSPYESPADNTRENITLAILTLVTSLLTQAPRPLTVDYSVPLSLLVFLAVLGMMASIFAEKFCRAKCSRFFSSSVTTLSTNQSASAKLSKTNDNELVEMEHPVKSVPSMDTVTVVRSSSVEASPRSAPTPIPVPVSSLQPSWIASSPPAPSIASASTPLPSALIVTPSAQVFIPVPSTLSSNPSNNSVPNMVEL